MTRTRDKGSQDQRIAVHTVHQIGPNRHLLPNGNMLCEGVPIARSGWLLYGPQEVPVKPAPNGIVYIERTADELFNDRTMGSFMGAAVTNDHPVEDVMPVNWRGLSGGFAINVRRGTGDEADFLLADLMLTDAQLIKAVQAGKVEVSAGYDANYTDLGNGTGRQTQIIGNHIALVEKGRCGPRCAVKDSAFIVPQSAHKGRPMSTRTPQRRRVLDDSPEVAAARQRVRDAEAELADAEAEAGEGVEVGGNVIHIHVGGKSRDRVRPAGDEGDDDGDDPQATRDKAIDERFSKIEGTLDKIGTALETLAKTGDGAMPPKAKEGDEDEEEEKKRKEAEAKGKKTGDSAALETGYVELASQAEILVPGFKVPTFDAALTRAATVDRMCNVRRKVLDQFGSSPEGQALLLAANGGQPVDLLTMDCAGAATLFGNAAKAKAGANNAAATRDAARLPEQQPQGVVQTGIITQSAFNEANQKFWEGK